MNAKDRLLEFLKYKNIGQTNFEIEVGISRGYINNNKGNIGTKIIEKISNRYPELNITWLTTGEGEMLKKEYNDEKAGLEPFKEQEIAYQNHKEFYSLINNLIQTNAQLVDSNAKLADSNNKLVENTIKKENSLEEKLNQFISILIQNQKD